MSGRCDRTPCPVATTLGTGQIPRSRDRFPAYQTYQVYLATTSVDESTVKPAASVYHGRPMTTDPARARGRAELLTLLAVAAVVLVADQATKAMVIGAIPFGERIDVVGDLFQLWHVRNTGAAFSLFEGGLLLFIVVTVLALGMVAYFHRSFVGRSRWLQVVLGVVLGGTLGNFIDRLRQGYVTDFLSFGFGDTRFPTFNIADSGVVVGIGLLVIILTFFTDAGPQEGTSRTEAPT